MAIKATVDKFGMTFSDAYHKVVRLSYESNDQKQFVHSPPAEPVLDEDGNPVPQMPTPPTETWVKKNYCNFEVATYASEETREAHAEPIYRSHYNLELSLAEGEADIIVQAYEYLKTKDGYEDAINC